jgi:hypothetical protein
VIEDELRRGPVRLRDLDVHLELGLQESVKSAVAAGHGVTFISRSGVEAELAAGTLASARVKGLEPAREISLVRVGDVLFELVQTGMDAAGLIGQPIDADMTTKVKGALTGILESAISNEVIDAYDAVAVRQQTLPSGDPSVIEAQFAYRPAVPLNYITVTFAIDLTSGEVTRRHHEPDFGLTRRGRCPRQRFV